MVMIIKNKLVLSVPPNAFCRFSCKFIHNVNVIDVSFFHSVTQSHHQDLTKMFKTLFGDESSEEEEDPSSIPWDPKCVKAFGRDLFILEGYAFNDGEWVRSFYFEFALTSPQ